MFDQSQDGFNSNKNSQNGANDASTSVPWYNFLNLDGGHPTAASAISTDTLLGSSASGISAQEPTSAQASHVEQVRSSADEYAQMVQDIFDPRLWDTTASTVAHPVQQFEDSQAENLGILNEMLVENAWHPTGVAPALPVSNTPANSFIPPTNPPSASYNSATWTSLTTQYNSIRPAYPTMAMPQPTVTLPTALPSFQPPLYIDETPESVSAARPRMHNRNARANPYKNARPQTIPNFSAMRQYGEDHPEMQRPPFSDNMPYKFQGAFRENMRASALPASQPLQYYPHMPSNDHAMGGYPVQGLSSPHPYAQNQRSAQSGNFEPQAPSYYNTRLAQHKRAPQGPHFAPYPQGRQAIRAGRDHPPLHIRGPPFQQGSSSAPIAQGQQEIHGAHVHPRVPPSHIHPSQYYAPAQWQYASAPTALPQAPTQHRGSPEQQMGRSSQGFPLEPPQQQRNTQWVPPAYPPPDTKQRPTSATSTRKSRSSRPRHDPTQAIVCSLLNSEGQLCNTLCADADALKRHVRSKQPDGHGIGGGKGKRAGEKTARGPTAPEEPEDFFEEEPSAPVAAVGVHVECTWDGYCEKFEKLKRKNPGTNMSPGNVIRHIMEKHAGVSRSMANKNAKKRDPGPSGGCA